MISSLSSNYAVQQTSNLFSKTSVTEKTTDTESVYEELLSKLNSTTEDESNESSDTKKMSLEELFQMMQSYKQDASSIATSSEETQIGSLGSIDTVGDGTLSTDEYDSSTISDLDTNGDGTVSLEEYAAVFADSQTNATSATETEDSTSTTATNEEVSSSDFSELYKKLIANAMSAYESNYQFTNNAFASSTNIAL